MLSLKRQPSLLTVYLQKKHHEEAKSSSAPKGQDLQLVPMGEVHTRSVRLDFPIFNGDDHTGCRNFCCGNEMWNLKNCCTMYTKRKLRSSLAKAYIITW